MSFLEGIQNFKKSHLKQTDTMVMTPDGSLYRETKDKYGRHHKTLVDPGASLGYLADVKPDLQVGVIMDGLIIGSQDVAADMELLKKYSVTHILNVASMVENLFPDEFRYKRINILDLPETKIVQYFPECFTFIDDAISKHGCVLVHCNAGVSRSASIVIGYLMDRKLLSFRESYELVKEKRPATRPNDGFMEQLRHINPKDF